MLAAHEMPLNIVFQASKLVPTKTLLLKHDNRRQGKRDAYKASKRKQTRAIADKRRF